MLINRATLVPVVLRTFEDALGGLVGAVIVATQSMAFGIAILGTPLGDLPSAARFGLVGLVCLCIASGIARGTVGLISAPTGPVMVLLGAIAALLADRGVTAAQLPAALATVIALAGLTQCVIGLTGAGRIVKLVPLPVIAGFMTGSGLLMIASQWGATFGPLVAGELRVDRAIPLMAGATTLVVMLLAKRLLPRVPGVIPGVIAGVATFHGLSAWLTTSTPPQWFVGALPALSLTNLVPGGIAFPDLPWMMIGLGAVALGAFASLDTLLTSLVADSETGQRHDTRRELVAQGVGHLVAGFAGGMAGAGTTGATVSAIRSGGRALAPLVCGVSVAAGMLWMSDATARLPVAVLAGVVVAVGLSIVERDIVIWWRRGRTRVDALIAVLVAVVTVTFDLMLAVGLGVVITAIQFIGAQVQAPVVARRQTATNARSLRVREEHENRLLDEHGDNIVLYDLRGAIVFATADRLYEQVRADVDRGAHIIFSLKRVTLVDITGLDLMRQIARRARDHSGLVVFADVHKRTGLGRKVHRTLRRTGLDTPDVVIKTFKSADVAFEQAENLLLTRFGPAHAPRSVELHATQIGASLSTGACERLAARIGVVDAARGERIYRAGEPGDTLYLVKSGNVDIRLPVGRRQWSRLARIGPGMAFGEVSFTLPGPHTATAVATEPCVLFTLTRGDFEALREEAPEICVTVLTTLAEVQSRRLRRANREIHQLNQY